MGNQVATIFRFPGTDLNGAADVLDHVLGGFGVRSGGGQFEILVQSRLGAGYGHDLAIRIGGGLGNQGHTFLIVNLGLGRIGSDGFIEGGDGGIDFAGIGSDCPQIVVILSGPLRDPVARPE